MNVFTLDLDPRTAATMHVDKHVVKMPLESAQMLSTALRSVGIDDARLYRATHRRHPCTLWAAATRSNFMWLIDLGLALCDEHRHRYPASRPHKSRTVIEVAREYVDALPGGELTPHAQAMPDACKVPGDAVAAYRRYYVAEKMRFASYRGRAWPTWMRASKHIAQRDPFMV